MLPRLLLLILLASGIARAGDCPCYAPDGGLILPDDYREWVFLTASLDMNYGALSLMGHSMFDNVFVDPKSWAEFKRSGHWPDGTVMVKEMRGAESKGSINKKGQFQADEIMAIEIHLRDDKRFTNGWRFFEFGSDRPAQPIETSASCYSCHTHHGAVDTTFTQFYPLAKAVAVKSGSFRAD